MNMVNGFRGSYDIGFFWDCSDVFTWLSNRFHCEYGAIDRTEEAKKEVDKIFVCSLKSKLFTNQKNAQK